MRMTSFRLILLRAYNVTLGRFAWGGKILRSCLLKCFVFSKKNKDRYTASSRFFDMKELD